MMRAYASLLLVLAVVARAGDVPVSSASQLASAVENARAGDVITLAPGIYELARTRISAAAAGSPETPIVVRAERLGDALIRWDNAGSFVEGFLVSGPWWRFENLDIEGVCASDTDCEHAFHIVGDADHVVVRGNRLHGFNAMIKANQLGGLFPDDAVIEGNELFNPAPRDTANPVTPIDVVGGRRWVLRENLIYDHAKAGGNQISYAAFLKGNSKDGLIERNLVICERFHTGQVRLGLSFGGGGSGPASICEESTCTPEHEGGLMRNNIIVNCPADVGIYLNEAADSQVHHNTLFNTTGIDVRFAASSVDLRNNLLNGRIRNRDGGQSTEGGNLEEVALADFRDWFSNPAAADFTLVDGTALVDLGELVPSVLDDYCGNPRDAVADIGAVEYSTGAFCDTTEPGGSDLLFRDGFEA
jgi:hypothetical protein